MSEAPNSTVLEILARSTVFQSVPSGDLERLSARCTHQRFRRGAPIMSFGDAGDSLAVVGRGRIKGTIPSPNGDGEFLIGVMWPGDCFGEVAVFDQKARAGTATAVTECEVVFVPRVELLAMMERRPAVSIRLVETVCDKLRTACELSLSLRFLDVPSRLYRRLLYLGRFDTRRDGNGIRIQHGLSQRELADSIGASREALNKVMGDWKRAGFVEFGRGYVVVVDPAALAMRIPASVRQGSLLECSEERPLEHMAHPVGRGGKIRS